MVFILCNYASVGSKSTLSQLTHLKDSKWPRSSFEDLAPKYSKDSLKSNAAAVGTEIECGGSDMAN